MCCRPTPVYGMFQEETPQKGHILVEGLVGA